jgi:hypothetical protein
VVGVPASLELNDVTRGIGRFDVQPVDTVVPPRVKIIVPLVVAARPLGQTAHARFRKRCVPTVDAVRVVETGDSLQVAVRT